MPRLRRVPFSFISLAAVVAVYSLLAFHLLPSDVVYSGDMGIKFVQARALLDNHFRSLAIPYRGEFLDPTGSFTPFRAPFILKTHGTVQAIFPPAGAVLEALFVWMDGLHGMRALSILGAILAIVAAMRLASPEDRPWVAAVIGLATPFWFYGVTEWEHAPAVGLTTAAFALALSDDTRAALAAGILAGAAAALRDECALVVPGLLFAFWTSRRSWRLLAAVVVGFGVVLALNGVMEVYWFGRPASAHLQHAVHLLREDTSAAQPQLTPLTARERYQGVVEYWLVGADWLRTLAWIAALAAAVALQRFGRIRAAAVVVAGVTIIAMADAASLVHAPKFVAGLYRSAPFLLFAALLRPPDAGSDRVRTVALVTTGIYLAVALLTTDTMGGKANGARLLLPLLPLLAVAAIANIRAHLGSGHRVSRLIGIAGGLLIACGFAIHLGSTIPAWIMNTRIRSRDIATVLESGSGVLVGDNMYTAQSLLPLYYRRIILLADTPARGKSLGALLAAHGVPDVVLVSQSMKPNTSLPPYAASSTSMHGLLLIQRWRRR
jgi:hypothetical protein